MDYDVESPVIQFDPLIVPELMWRCAVSECNTLALASGCVSYSMSSVSRRSEMALAWYVVALCELQPHFVPLV